MMLLDWVLNISKGSKTRPYFVGLSAPQGAGKTTLSRAFCEQAQTKGLYAVAISLDDFYLTRDEQVKLAALHAQNPYLQVRGYPLTHDVALALTTLAAFKTMATKGGSVAVPRYDKSAFAGKGDRCPRDQWTTVTQTPDIILLEGWMLGFQPVPRSDLPNTPFETVNEGLGIYEPLLKLLDAFIWLEPEDVGSVVAWRMEAEEKMRAKGLPGMSPDETRAYIERFVIAYETYLPALRRKSPIDGPFLHARVDRNRRITKTI